VTSAPLRIAIVAGETSGDQLGAALMSDLRDLRPDIVFSGIGGPAMEAAGFKSLFPMHDLSVMGFVPVLARLPLLLRRIRETADDLVKQQPDAIVFIDSPDFCKRVARRLRKRAPHLLTIGYVAPSVWAWRPGRAAKLRPLFDHLMAILPFEPRVMAQLGGPPTTYVGHPLLERRQRSHPRTGGRAATVLLLPGSRRSEIRRLLPVFGEAAAAIRSARPEVEFVLPTVPHLENEIRGMIQSWPIQPRIALGADEKWVAFQNATAALAASGTVTLELAIAEVPMVVAYQVASWEAAIIKRLVMISTPVLPDIIAGTQHIPLFLQNDVTAANLRNAVLPLMDDSDEREQQRALFKSVHDKLQAGLPAGVSSIAADTVLRLISQRL
jgi:lipid-A-disaccharide synthase